MLLLNSSLSHSKATFSHTEASYPLTHFQLNIKLTNYLGYAPHPEILSILWNELIQEEKRENWQDTVILERYEQLESYFPCF